MVVPMRLAATMRLRLAGGGGAVAGEVIGTTSKRLAGTCSCRHTVGIRRSGAHVAGQHSSGVGYARGHHADSREGGSVARRWCVAAELGITGETLRTWVRKDAGANMPTV